MLIRRHLNVTNVRWTLKQRCLIIVTVLIDNVDKTSFECSERQFERNGFQFNVRWMFSNPSIRHYCFDVISILFGVMNVSWTSDECYMFINYVVWTSLERVLNTMDVRWMLWLLDKVFHWKFFVRFYKNN